MYTYIHTVVFAMIQLYGNSDGDYIIIKYNKILLSGLKYWKLYKFEKAYVAFPNAC